MTQPDEGLQPSGGFRAWLGERRETRATWLEGGLRGRLRRLGGLLGLVLGAEDGRRGLAGEQALELVGLDRLALEQDLRRGVEVRPVRAEDVARHLVRLLDNAADLAVDLARYVIRIVGLGAELAAQERLAMVVAEDTRAELLAHPEAHDH